MTVNRIAELEAELTRLRNERNVLKEQGVYKPAVTDQKILAVALHDMLCHQGHEDMCGWYYGVKQGDLHDWNEFAHAHYLGQAGHVLKFCYEKHMDVTAVVELLHLLKLTE